MSLSKARLNQLIQEEWDRLLQETNGTSGEAAAEAAKAGFWKTAEKLGKKAGITFLKANPRTRWLGNLLGVADKTIKGSKSALKAATLKSQYGVDTPGRGASPLGTGIVGVGPGLGSTASDFCFTQKCRNQRSFRKRIIKAHEKGTGPFAKDILATTGGRQRALDTMKRAGFKVPRGGAAEVTAADIRPAWTGATPTRVVNEPERTDAWRAQMLDAMGWLTMVPGLQPVGIAASVAGAAMPAIDKAAEAAAIEGAHERTGTVTTPTKEAAQTGYRMPVERTLDRARGTYLTPEQAKKETGLWHSLNPFSENMQKIIQEEHNKLLQEGFLDKMRGKTQQVTGIGKKPWRLRGSSNSTTTVLDSLLSDLYNTYPGASNLAVKIEIESYNVGDTEVSNASSNVFSALISQEPHGMGGRLMFLELKIKKRCPDMGNIPYISKNISYDEGETILHSLFRCLEQSERTLSINLKVPSAFKGRKSR